MEKTTTTRKIVLGCAIAALVVLALSILLAAFGVRAFFRFGVGSDLSDYRTAVLKTDLDRDLKDGIIRDLDELRMSLDTGNRFTFGQWLEIDDGMRAILSDGRIDEDELGPLQTDITRMKRIQGISHD